MNQIELLKITNDRLTLELFNLNLTVEILVKFAEEKGLFTEDEFVDFYGEYLRKSNLDEQIESFNERVFYEE